LALEPAFVRIDVEGAEPQVLRGMAETIERHRPIFLIEDGGSHDEVSAFFAEGRYEPYQYLAGEDRLQPPRDRVVGQPVLLARRVPGASSGWWRLYADRGYRPYEGIIVHDPFA